MSRRISLAHGLTGVFLIVYAVFALLLLALGVLLVAFADRIAAAGQGGSTIGYVVGGLVALGFALLMLRGTVRDVGAVASIEIDDGDGWTLRTRYGRIIARLEPDTPRAFELEGQRLYLLSASVPKRQDLVLGRLVAPDRPAGYRLAVSGPFTYDRALAELGYDVQAPRPGERVQV